MTPAGIRPVPARERPAPGAATPGAPEPEMPTPDVSGRTHLLAVLADITRDVAASALVRCPYRDGEDRCTFGHACRNQRRLDGTGHLRCSGAPLNANSISNSKGGRP